MAEMTYRVHSQNQDNTTIEFTLELSDKTFYKYFQAKTEHWDSDKRTLLRIMKDRINENPR